MRINKLLLIASFFLFVIFFSPRLALAEMSCPPYISPNNPIRTMTDLKISMPLDFEVLYEIEALQGIYKIPVGYGWTNVRTSSTPKGWSDIATDARIVNKTPASGFWFWMPSLRYPEVNLMTYLSFYPCEDGRTLPKEGEYIVHAVVANPETMADGAELIPSQMVTNMLSVQSGKENLNLKEEYGLIRFESKKYPDKAIKRYHHIDGTSPQAMISCFTESPKSLCWGYFYFSDTRFYVTLRFPNHELPHWKDMLKSTQILLDKWRVKTPEEITRFLDEQKNAPKGEE